MTPRLSGGEVPEECGLDNRDIVDDGSAQALKEVDILRLREQARGHVSKGRKVHGTCSDDIATICRM